MRPGLSRTRGDRSWQGESGALMPAPLKVIPTGARFGSVVALGHAGTARNGSRWTCICDCGRVVTVVGAALRFARTRSCGCWRTALLRAKPRNRRASAVDRQCARSVT